MRVGTPRCDRLIAIPGRAFVIVDHCRRGASCPITESLNPPPAISPARPLPIPPGQRLRATPTASFLMALHVLRFQGTDVPNNHPGARPLVPGTPAVTVSAAGSGVVLTAHSSGDGVRPVDEAAGSNGGTHTG